MRPVARSAMHHVYVAHGPRLTVASGWEVPAAFAGAEAEVRATREGAGLWDLSPCTKWDVLGPGAESALETLSGAAASRVGRAVPACVGETAVLGLRLDAERVLLLGAPGAALEAGLRAALPAAGAHLINATSGLAGLRLAGPSARAILATLTPLDAGAHALPDMACAQTALAHVHAILLRRDVAGLPAFEAYVARNYGAYLWEALLDAGRERGLAPCGLEADALLAAGRS